MYYGQFTPPVDAVLHQRYFPQKRDGFFIECGAYDGLLECSCKFFEETMGWRGINIEAAPRIFSRLLVNRPNSFLNLNVALSSQNGRASFNDIVSPTGWADGNGSLKHAPEHLADLARHGCGLSPVEVETLTYRDVMVDHQIAHVDLMVLDVEGCELQAIEGMVGSTALPTVMCVEFSFTGLEPISAALAPLGFVFDFVQDVNAYFHRP